MGRSSVFWDCLLGLILLFIFILEGVRCGYNEAVKSVFLTTAGTLLVVFVYFALKRFRDSLSKELYGRLGFDLLYEFLSGKRRLTRQLFGIWILFILPFAVFGGNVLEQRFWVFVIPITLIGTLWLYFTLNWEDLK